RTESACAYQGLGILRARAVGRVDSLRSSTQVAEDAVWIERGTHDWRDTVRVGRADQVGDVLVADRLVLHVNGDEVETAGGRKLHQLRRGRLNVRAKCQLAATQHGFGAVATQTDAVTAEGCVSHRSCQPESAPRELPHARSARART